MLGKREVLDFAERGAKLSISVKYDDLSIKGVAVCDTVKGKDGVKIRAKFRQGVKAILDLEDYATQWRAEEIKAKEGQEQNEKEPGEIENQISIDDLPAAQ